MGINHEPPFVILNEDEVSGLSIDLWESIALQRGQAFEYEIYNDHLGLIRALDFKSIDLAINPIHVNALRLKMLDATQPYFDSSIGVASSNMRRKQLSSFLRNFFSFNFLRIILGLAIVIFIFGSILWVVERKHNRRQFRPGMKGLFDGIWWSAVTMTTVGYGDKAPKSRLGRVIAMVWMFTAIVIISGFTATIASTLTVSSLKSNIQDLNDLRKVGIVGTVYSSSSEDFLLSNKVGIDRMYDDIESAIGEIASNELDLLVYDKAVLNYFISTENLDNKVTLLPVSFNKQYRSFFLPKNSSNYNWINEDLVKEINYTSFNDLLSQYHLSEE